VFEEAHVSGHERGRGEAEDLPEGKIPGHYGEHDAERLIAYETAGGVRRDILIGEKARGLFGVEAADPRALFRLLHGRGQRLSHLNGHQSREAVLIGLQNLRRAEHPAGALREGRLAVVAEGASGALDFLLHLVGVERIEDAERLAGRGIDA
jgi:hypothetical protein